MTVSNINDLVQNLRQREAAIGAAHIEFTEKAARAHSVFHVTAQTLSLCICGLTSLPNEITAEEARLATLEEKRAIVVTKQTELEQQIAEAPDWRLMSNVRQRDAEYVRQQTLTQQFQRLRAGTLLFAPTQAYARIEDLDARLKRSNERIERLRAQLAEHLQQAESLLAGAVTQ